MKARSWSVQLEKWWHGSLCCYAAGAQPMSPAKIVQDMKPTVGNVKKAISELFPDQIIDEKYMTVKEQIAEGLKSGSFSISLTGGNEYESLFVLFMDI